MGVSKAVEIPGVLQVHLAPPKHEVHEETEAQAPTDTAISVVKNLLLSDYLLTRPLED